MNCNKHKIPMTFRAGKQNELFCKQCEKLQRRVRDIQIIKKAWWKFW